MDITVFPSKLRALKDKIHASAYPGINTDNCHFSCRCRRRQRHDSHPRLMWENRAVYFTELNNLGANIVLADPHRVFVNGPTPLKANQIVLPAGPAAINDYFGCHARRGRHIDFAKCLCHQSRLRKYRRAAELHRRRCFAFERVLISGHSHNHQADRL